MMILDLSLDDNDNDNDNDDDSFPKIQLPFMKS